MINKVKLKHLPLFLDGDVAMLQLLKIFGIRRRFWRKKEYLKTLDKAFSIIDRLQNLDVREVAENKESPIKRPEDIDEIPLIAMIEVQNFLKRDENSLGFVDILSEMIAMVCFSSNYSSDFSVSSSLYLRFKNRILDQPLLDMLGLYNWIDAELKKSEQKWDNLFNSVRIDDPDYIEGGGERMSPFAVVETISDICVDFNVPYERAWQLPYALSQTNSLKKATRNRVQHDMMLIKERKIKRNQKNNL